MPEHAEGNPNWNQGPNDQNRNTTSYTPPFVEELIENGPAIPHQSCRLCLHQYQDPPQINGVQECDKKNAPFDRIIAEVVHQHENDPIKYKNEINPKQQGNTHSPGLVPSPNACQNSQCNKYQGQHQRYQQQNNRHC